MLEFLLLGIRSYCKAVEDHTVKLVVVFVKVFFCFIQGIARTQSPTNINYAPESPTFGVIAEVNPPGVQWTGLALGEPP